nr:protein GVQW3-like [Hydra vulgaris]
MRRVSAKFVPKLLNFDINPDILKRVITGDESWVYVQTFYDGREDANGEPRSGRPTSSAIDENVQAVKKIVLENRRITIREIAEDVGISVGSCHKFISNVLGMRRVSAKFVPKLLNFDINPDILKRVITGDESWVYGYDIETKAQLSQWKSPGEPRPNNARQVRSNDKVLLTVFFDYHGVVHQEFLPYGCMVNKQYYVEVMRRLRKAIRRKRPELCKNNSWST